MTNLITIKNALSAGELSPSLYGRTDIQKYPEGCTTLRNFFSNYRGGVSSRAGLEYVGTSLATYPNPPPRLIPFQFSISQGFALEFSDHKLRFIANGNNITETPITVSSVDAGGVFTTSAPHGFSAGDWVFDSGNSGFSGLVWIIHSVSTTTSFTVISLFGSVITSATPSSGGTVARIYTIDSPYAGVDLPYLKYTQSADVMTLTCVNQTTGMEYPPYDLTRHGNANWSFTQETFQATITPPTNLIATAQPSDITTTWYAYVVTAVDAVTEEESVASNLATCQNNDISLQAGSNTLTWTPVSGAGSYNVYVAPASYSVPVPVSSNFGFIGNSLGASFTDNNIQPDFAVSPPLHDDPFSEGAILQIIPTASGANYSQQTIGYSINTSTGSGFAGFPVVANGGLADFIITNQGNGYQAGDTIVFTDSGGGVATGNLNGSGNPSDGEFIVLNGVEIKFRRSTTALGFDEVYIGGTLALTLQNLANFLNSSTDISLSCATYTYDPVHLFITYKTPGTAGNAYTLSTGGTPFTPSGANLTGGGTDGSGASASLRVGPESGTFPSTCAYFQQRRVYASSLNNPDTYWMSKPGLYSNMDFSTPSISNDAVTGTPWAQQINGIQWLVPMPGGLVVLTGKGAWQVNGGSQTAVTPSNQTATPQAYNGTSATVPPLTINYDILYVQAKGSFIRDLSYNFFVNIYTGTDITVLSNHLFTNYQVVQWAWCEEPYKIVWAVRNDGTLLSLTYVKEQDVYAWARHDTNGLFLSVCSITEPPVDAGYFVVQRFVEGAWRYYIERMDDRIWDTVEDTFCVDSGLTYPQTFPASVLSSSGISGVVTFTTTSPVFSSGNVGDIIRAGGGIGVITAFNSSTSVTANLTQNISLMTQDNLSPIMIPQTAGSWSVSIPTNIVSGLNHLEGLEVTGLADGSVIDPQIVTNGSITLPVSASNITVGLPYVCQAQTMYIDHPGPGGNTVQGRRKDISAIGVRVEATRGLQIGANQPDAAAQQLYAPTVWADMVDIKDRTAFTNAGNAVPLFTGDWYQSITSGWSEYGQIAIQQKYPLPANILALVAFWSLGDDR